MHIHVVPILNDNYAYIIQSDTEVAVVDPGEAAPIIDFLNDRYCSLVLHHLFLVFL